VSGPVCSHAQMRTQRVNEMIRMSYWILTGTGNGTAEGLYSYLTHNLT
jgi:hypothetical protein